MGTYTTEASDVPVLFCLRPTYNASQSITAANATINFQNRVVNNGDNTDILYKETKSASFDMIGAGYASKTVNVAGIGNITYQQVAAAIKKIADAERLLLP